MESFMKSLSIIKTVSAGLGILFFYLGSRYSSGSLIFLGVAFFGAYFSIDGINTVINRRIILDPNNEGTQKVKSMLPPSWFTWADVARGTLTISLGVFLVIITLMGFSGLAKPTFNYFVRHPGAVLLTLSAACFLYALVTITGTGHLATNSKWKEWLRFTTSQLFPGFFWLALGLFFVGLGLLELFAPEVFDHWGGSFLESFFGDW